MPKPVVINIAHELGGDEARRRLEGGFGRIRSQIGNGMSFEERWEGNRLQFSAAALGQKVVGRVDVLEDSVRIELDLPWGLAMMTEKLQGRVKKAGMLLLENDPKFSALASRDAPCAQCPLEAETRCGQWFLRGRCGSTKSEPGQSVRTKGGVEDAYVAGK